MPKDRVERDDEDLVRLYLTDIGQYPLLTKDDEVRLAQTIEAGTEARFELDRLGLTVDPAHKRELKRAAEREARADADALDELVSDFNATADDLACAALLAAGCRQHNRGEWRKRREQDRPAG